MEISVSRRRIAYHPEHGRRKDAQIEQGIDPSLKGRWSLLKDGPRLSPALDPCIAK
jgi:hypothetical protein